jgi:hypothetical protein
MGSQPGPCGLQGYLESAQRDNRSLVQDTLAGGFSCRSVRQRMYGKISLL